jgi:hypothetical protein
VADLIEAVVLVCLIFSEIYARRDSGHAGQAHQERAWFSLNPRSGARA